MAHKVGYQSGGERLWSKNVCLSIVMFISLFRFTTCLLYLTNASVTPKDGQIV
jgi:hypothetical protein